MASRYIGLISGTSMDAIDAVLADLRCMPPELVATHVHPFADSVREDLNAVVAGPCDDPHLVWRLDRQLGELFAEAARALLRETGTSADEIRAIGSHGQTVAHFPTEAWPYTVQLGDPSVIAERTGITTVADFRRRDMAAGGQGAPLAPAFHRAALTSHEIPRAVVNIGGIANITALPPDQRGEVIGFDSGPGNTLMDLWAGEHLGTRIDTDGRWAAGGRLEPTLLSSLEADPYFAAPPPKSTGREYFHLGWLREHLEHLEPAPRARDVQRALCELTANTIARAIEAHANDSREVFVCGGGTHNATLMAALSEKLRPRPVRSTAELGLDPDWVEAIAFAWLAHQALEGKPGNLPSVTGARHAVVLGAIYPA